MPFYAVHKGRQVGIFEEWKECQRNVIGFKGAIFKKFKERSEAELFVKNGYGTPIDEKYDIRVFTDGACDNNGYRNAKAGMGIYFGKDDERNVSQRIDGKQSNNTAELKAVLEAISILSDEIAEGKIVQICTDSKYAIQCCTTYGKKQSDKGWKKNIPNKTLVQKAYGIFSILDNVKFKYVEGHTGIKDGNYYADLLAKHSLNSD